MNMAILGDVPCSLVEVDRRFGDDCCLCYLGDNRGSTPQKTAIIIFICLFCTLFENYIMLSTTSGVIQRPVIKVIINELKE
jgi:hypothetical protein